METLAGRLPPGVYALLLLTWGRLHGQVSLDFVERLLKLHGSERVPPAVRSVALHEIRRIEEMVELVSRAGFQIEHAERFLARPLWGLMCIVGKRSAISDQLLAI